MELLILFIYSHLLFEDFFFQKLKGHNLGIKTILTKLNWFVSNSIYLFRKTHQTGMMNLVRLSDGKQS